MIRKKNSVNIQVQNGFLVLILKLHVKIVFVLIYSRKIRLSNIYKKKKKCILPIMENSRNNLCEKRNRRGMSLFGI